MSIFFLHSFICVAATLCILFRFFRWFIIRLQWSGVIIRTCTLTEWSGVEYSLPLYYLYAFHVLFVDHLYNFTYQGSSTCFHCVNVPGLQAPLATLRALSLLPRFASLAIMLIHAWFQLKHARWFESQHLTMKDSNDAQPDCAFFVMCFVMDASDASAKPFSWCIAEDFAIVLHGPQ